VSSITESPKAGTFPACNPQSALKTERWNRGQEWGLDTALLRATVEAAANWG